MWLTLLGRVVQFVATLVGVRVMTTLLPPTEYAHYAVLTALSAFFVFCCVSPVCTYVHREINRWVQQGVLLRPWFYTVGYVLLVALLTALVLRFYGEALHTLALQNAWAPWVVGLNVFSASVSHVFIVGLNVLGHVRAFAWLTMGLAVLSLLACALAVLYGGGTALMWLLGLALGQCVLSMCVVVYAWKAGLLKRADALFAPLPSTHVGAGLTAVWTFAMPVAVSTLFIWLQTYGHRLVLEHSVSMVQLGLFAAGYGLAVQAMLAVELVLNTWFLPRFYQGADTPAQGRRTAWLQYAKSMWFPSVVGMAVVYSAAQPIGHALLAPQYHSAVQYVQMGVVVEWLRIQVGVLGLYFHQYKRTKALVLPIGVGAVLALGLIAWRVPIDGLDITLPCLALGAVCMAMGLLLRITPGHRPNLWQCLVAMVWLSVVFVAMWGLVLRPPWALWPLLQWFAVWLVLGLWSLVLATQKPTVLDEDHPYYVPEKYQK
jgi:O-antigen/teichoic acid export membrane protein